jgi:multiple sugar transport system substrate-binding protein
MDIKKICLSRVLLVTVLIASFCITSFTIPVNAKQQQQLVIWDWSDVYKNEYRKAIDPVLTKFKTKNPNVELKIEPILNDDIRTKLLSAAAAGNLPDVAYLDGQWLYEFVQNGLVIPIDRYVAKWGQKKDFPNSVWKSVTVKGKVYGIPGDGDVRTLLYRTDLFAKAGIKNPPKTWSELVKCAKLLTKDTNGDGKIDQWGFALNGGNSEHTSMRSLPWIWDLGGDFVDSKGKSALKSPAVLKTVTFMNSLVNVEKVSPPDSYMNTKKEVANLIKSGQAAMAIVGSWEWNGDASFLKTDSIKDKIASAPIPLPDNAMAKNPYTAAGYGVWVIFNQPKTAPVKNVAWDWINYCTTSQHMIDIFKYGTGNLGLRKSVFSDSEFQSNPVFKTFINVMPYARPRPITPYYELLSNEYRKAVQAALSKSMTPEQALKQSQQETEAEIKK